jgi:EpsI family protein
VMLGHLSSNRLATGVDHLVYGWLFFGFVMLVTFWIGSRYRDSENVQVASAVPAMPLSKGTAKLSLAGATVGLLLVTGVWPLIDRALELPETRTVTLPSIVVPGWQAASSTFDNFTPHFQNPSAVRQQQFRKGDRQVGLYIAYYRSESAERKLVSSQNVLVTSQDPVWHAISSQTSSVAISGDTVDVNTTLLKGKSGEALVAWQWYWANDSVTASPAVAKARITWQRLTGRGDDSAAIVVYTLADRNAETLNPAELREFVGEAWPAVVNALLQTRQTQ